VTQRMSVKNKLTNRSCGLISNALMFDDVAVSRTFEAGCESVSKAIVDQINKWQTEENCKSGGEKCLYKVKFYFVVCAVLNITLSLPLTYW